jgi:hypothetical protein
MTLNDFLLNQASINSEKLQMDVRREWEHAMQQPRFAATKRLNRHGYKVYSQNEEDGMIAEILARIGPVPETFVEFGVENGLECNTLRLLMAGWKGLWMEGDKNYVAQIGQNLATQIGAGQMQVKHSFVTKDNINQLISEAGFNGPLGLVSIDIDGNDIWVWKALSAVQPAIVVIEYNATWTPPLSIAQPDDPNIFWRGTNYFGASLKALEKAGAEKGYQLVGCNWSGSNAFFVQKDLCGDKFHNPATAEELHEPPRYWLRHLRAGHRAGVGPVVTV